jgi:branched-subunit amino acid aminotransferase/4-amino-4-deoxychorismate lyase
MSEPLVYLSGKFLPASEAHLAIFDAGIVLGATVTEMTRTFRQRPFKLREHLERLARSLKYTRIETGLSIDEMETISQRVIEHNAKLLPAGGELGLVHFVTAGQLPMYAGMAGRLQNTTPTICVHTFPLPFQFWAQKYQSGQHLVTPSTRHVPPECFDPKMKYRSRMHYYLADREAQLADPDASALLLDLDGNVTETSGANFLIVERGTIVSPTTRNTLPGISRATVIELAARLGIPFVERDFQFYNIVNADEAFTASTPYCVLPVTKINGISIADGEPGPVIRRLLSAWSDLVGVDIEKQMVEGAKRVV